MSENNEVIEIKKRGRPAKAVSVAAMMQTMTQGHAEELKDAVEPPLQAASAQSQGGKAKPARLSKAERLAAEEVATQFEEALTAFRDQGNRRVLQMPREWQQLYAAVRNSMVR